MYNKTMLVFLLIALCASVPLIDFYNIFAKRNIRNLMFIILQVVIIQIFSLLLIGFLEINFSAYQIISYAFIGAYVSVFIAFIIFQMWRKRSVYEWKDLKRDVLAKLKQNWILYVCILLFIFVSLFQTNRFEDTLYYFEISTMFQYDVFPSSYTYIVPGSYFFYGALSGGFVTQWYYLFTPVSFFIIMLSIISDYLVAVFKGKYKYLQMGSIMFFVLLFSLFSAATFISGNMYISACLIGLCMICMKERDYKTPALLFLVTQFYSSTGALLSMALVVSMFIYLIAYENINRIFRLAPLYSISLLGIPLLMFSFVERGFGDVSPFWMYLFLGLLAGMLSIILVINFIYARRNQKLAFFEFSFMQTKWFASNFMKYLILFITCGSMIVIIIYYQAVYSQPFVYSMIPFYLMLALLFPLIIFNYIKQYKQNININFLLMMNICLISFVSIFLWIFNIENGSIWRVMMVLPTIGIGESVISYCILWALNIGMTVPCLDSFNWTPLTRLNLLRSDKKAIIGLSTAILISSFVPITVVSIDPAMANYSYSTYTANVYKNINLFQLEDINKMLKLSKVTAKSNWNLVFDNFASAYIATPPGSNSSYTFYSDIFKYQGIENVSTDHRTNPLGALGFYKSRLISSKWKNPAIINQTVTEFGSFINQYIQSLEWKNNSDVLFLDKASEYFKFIDFNAKLVYDLNIFGEIAVITKDIVVLDAIKANI